MLHASGIGVAREGKTDIAADSPLPSDFAALGFPVVEPGPDSVPGPVSEQSPASEHSPVSEPGDAA